MEVDHYGRSMTTDNDLEQGVPSGAPCSACGKNPRIPGRTICGPCRSAREQERKLKDYTKTLAIPCAVDGCDQPRYAGRTQVTSYCAHHRREKAAEKRREKGIQPRVVPPDGMSFCSGCQQMLPLSAFGLSTTRKRGVQSRCKECQKNRYRERYRSDDEFRERRKAATIRNKRVRFQGMYGITYEDFQAEVESQNGHCLICDRDDDPLVPDHCHNGGGFRGAICGRCNKGIGQFADNPQWLARASSYLNDVGQTEEVTHGLRKQEEEEVS